MLVCGAFWVWRFRRLVFSFCFGFCLFCLLLSGVFVFVVLIWLVVIWFLFCVC